MLQIVKPPNCVNSFTTTVETWKTRPVHRALEAVARVYLISPKQLRRPSSRRFAHQARQRFLVVWLARHLGAGPSHIGHYLGGFDHTSMIYACRRADELRQDDEAFRRLGDELLARLREGQP